MKKFTDIKDYFIKINKRNNSFIFNIYIGLIFIFAIFFPDYILKLFGTSSVKLDIKFLPVIFLFGIFLSMAAKKYIVFIVLGIFFIFESIQLHFMAYFGQPINPPEIGKIFSETSDIAESGFAYFSAVWYVLPAMVFSYGLFIYFYNKIYPKSIKNKISYILIIIFLSLKPIKAYQKPLTHFLPTTTRNSIQNSINTFSYYFVKEMWNNNKIFKADLKPYSITKLNNFETPDIVIFLVGESMNYRHQSLYGYERKTTPNLDKIKNNPNFIYRKSIGSSVSTASSLPFVFNVVREPVNIQESFKTNSLFKLAKENNYKTYFYTTQDAKNMNHIGTIYIDKTLTADDSMILKKNKDDILLKYLDEAILDKSKNKKFISFFQRNIHAPYERRYKPEFAKYNIEDESRFDRMTNSYDNAMLFEDYIIGQFIERVKNIKDKSVILIITSDHGQLLGENKKYGHNTLNMEIAEIPFMVYYNDKYKKNIDFDSIPENISHYEVSKLVANILGYDIHNPNDDGTYFIHGNNIYFDNLIIPYRREKNNKIIKEKITSTSEYFIHHN